MGDDEDNGERRPGPSPERLWLPYEDWREALREALVTDRPAEGAEPEDGEGDDPTK